MSASRPPKKRRREPAFCDHCNRFVPHTTFYQHKAKFYDAVSNTWNRSENVSDSDTDVELYDEDCTSFVETAETSSSE